MGKKMIVIVFLGWDDFFLEKFIDRWQCWRNAFLDLEKVFMYCCYYFSEFGLVIRVEIYVFLDVSQRVIGVVIYFRLFNIRDEVVVLFVFSQAKVLLINFVSILRFEFCRVVLVD